MAEPIVFNKDGLFVVAVWENPDGMLITLDKGVGKYRHRIYLSPAEARTVDEILHKALVELATIQQKTNKKEEK